MNVNEQLGELRQQLREIRSRTPELRDLTTEVFRLCEQLGDELPVAVFSLAAAASELCFAIDVPGDAPHLPANVSWTESVLSH